MYDNIQASNLPLIFIEFKGIKPKITCKQPFGS